MFKNTFNCGIAGNQVKDGIFFSNLFLQAENIMLLELDMSPPTMFHLNPNGAHLERAFSPRLIQHILNVPVRERSTSYPRVRKSQSW